MMKIKNVVSLFDGIACGYEALYSANIQFDKYFASEIDPYCRKVVSVRHPDIEQMGDVRDINFYNFSSVDLLLGGSPCQNVSRCGKREGLEGSQSSLFWYYVEALKILRPKYFLFENVASMNVSDFYTVGEALQKVFKDKVVTHKIDSALLSAQHRERLYWTNIPVASFKPVKTVVKDILAREYETEEDKYHFLNRPVDWIREDKLKIKPLMPIRLGTLSGLSHAQSNRVYSIYGKSTNLVANSGGSGGKTGLYKIPVEEGYILRKFLPVECERLQTLPDNYTQVEGVSNTQRYKMINNGWTVDIIAHILKGIKNE